MGLEPAAATHQTCSSSFAHRPLSDLARSVSPQSSPRHLRMRLACFARCYVGADHWCVICVLAGSCTAWICCVVCHVL
ncbi:hypothetical protein BD311DRAFT_372667 [Dichomitus squalens]|uniref:Uncharacterized protein n=1 Tax=Dichomitus squalens TaxID=114155 RepID=A0A4Q9MN58_9APHY|nr:hypothetical protein BD311DRAFT_372667 [Dichomitus squalens]